MTVWKSFLQAKIRFLIRIIQNMTINNDIFIIFSTGMFVKALRPNQIIKI